MKSELHIPEAAPDAPQDGGLSFKAYDGLEHALNDQELENLGPWLSKVIPAK